MRYVPPVHELRARLPCEAVLADLDLRPSPSGAYLCPFHPDRKHPNLVCLPPREGDPAHRFLCRACGEKGDSVDLVRRLHGLRYGEALAEAARILDETDEEARPTKASPLTVPTAAWEARLAELRARALRHAPSGLLGYAARFEPSEELDRYLVEQWGWGLTEGAEVAVPHRDPLGTLTGVKLRDRSGFLATHGSLPHLYGGWRGRREPCEGTLVCEGESDAAHADRALGGEWHVLALPSGAGKQAWNERWRLEVEGPAVVTAFDGDTAGREATEMWRERVGSAALEVPPGADLRSSGIDLPVMLPLTLPNGAATV